MKWSWPVWQFFILATLAQVRNESDERPAGLLDKIIIEMLESLRPHLADLTTEFQTFETGDQELGSFRGHLNEVTVEGLDKFQIKILQTSLLDVKNLTIVEEKIEARGRYKINGSLAFPMSRNDIHLFGEGPFRAKLSNVSISFMVKLRYNMGLIVVKDLDIIIELEKMNMHLKNLMNGGELEDVFNRLINDVGLIVFNYYKNPILEAVKPKIKEIIEETLNRKDEP